MAVDTTVLEKYASGFSLTKEENDELADVLAKIAEIVINTYFKYLPSEQRREAEQQAMMKVLEGAIQQHVDLDTYPAFTYAYTRMRNAITNMLRKKDRRDESQTPVEYIDALKGSSYLNVSPTKLLQDIELRVIELLNWAEFLGFLDEDIKAAAYQVAEREIYGKHNMPKWID